MIYAAKAQIICANFFDFEGNFDLILEQTFFCAIDSSERELYIKKSTALLASKDFLFGLLFQKELFDYHPLFG